MDLIPFPGTALQVSPLCLGTMTFGTPVGRPEAVALVHRALDQGINFIDTANMYEGYTRFLGSPGGLAEAYLGAALKGRRHQAIVATKAGNPIGPDPEDAGLSPAHLQRECERSLQRLQTDAIDLYYLHRPDPDTPLAESIATCAALIEAGKIRHWGLSNFDAAQTQQALDLCAAHHWPRPVGQQPPYSLLNRAIEADLLPLCRRENLAVVPYQILQGGLLTGKYLDGIPAHSRAAEQPAWLPLLEDGDTRAQIAALHAQAQAQNLSLFDYTLRTTAAVPGITSLILGVKGPEQIDAAVQALA